MEIPKTNLQRMAFGEFTRPQNLTCHPCSPAFLKGLHNPTETTLGQAFGSQETVEDYSKLHVEGVLAHQEERGKNVWNELAPKLLKEFPLPAESL